MTVKVTLKKAGLGLVMALTAASLAGAQTLAPPLAGPPSGIMQVPLGDAPQYLHLMAGTSRDVSLPLDVKTASYTRGGVVEIVPISARKYQLLGIGSGRTDVVFYDNLGRRVLSLDVQVDQNLAGLSETINRIAPSANVEAIAQNDRIILIGQVDNAAQSGRIAQVAGAFVSDPKNVVNLLTIAGRDQVMLRVRIVEMQRNVIKQLGFDTNAIIGRIGESQIIGGNLSTFAVNGGFQGQGRFGATLDTTQQPMLEVPCAPGLSGSCYKVINGPADASNWDTATGRATVGSDGLNKGDAMLKAFERVGMARILAEPNLTAVSGEGATFQSGGEFPVPTGQDNNGRVSIEFKKYGIGLGFTPVVLSEGRISLKMSTEVSELSSQGAFTLSTGATGAALTVPGLNVRRAESVVEMPSGGSMMIAGLIQEQSRENIDGIPGAGKLGPLGAPFRSRDYLSNEKELVIIVTAILVKPTDAGSLQTPADGFEIANDAQTVLMGRINHAYKISPDAVSRRTYEGPYGHVID